MKDYPQDYPRKIWIQYYDDNGQPLDPEERTFSPERVTQHDACYMRWGKPQIIPEVEELDRLLLNIAIQGHVIDDLLEIVRNAGRDIELIRRDGIAVGILVYE